MNEETIERAKQITACVTPTELPTEANWVARLPRPIRKTLENFVLVLLCGFIVCQVYITRNEITSRIIAGQSPIEYGTWHSDKEEYTPGELIKFSYTRKTTFSDAVGPLAAVNIDSFENKTTGEVFPGSFVGRVIDHPGVHHRTAVRRVPPYATPGEYVFEGWARAETALRTLPATFQSNRFQVSGPSVGNE